MEKKFNRLILLINSGGSFTSKIPWISSWMKAIFLLFEEANPQGGIIDRERMLCYISEPRDVPMVQSILKD